MDSSTPVVVSSTAGAGTKKTLQEMSKEELIQRCRNLLALAQKAKLARDGEQTLFGLVFSVKLNSIQLQYI